MAPQIASRTVTWSLRGGRSAGVSWNHLLGNESVEERMLAKIACRPENCQGRGHRHALGLATSCDLQPCGGRAGILDHPHQLERPSAGGLKRWEITPPFC
jgi:hypothetical protein